MQAIRVERDDRRRSFDPRWLQHVALLGACGVLLSWAVAARTPGASQLVDVLPTRFLAPPSTSVQDWRPIRVPVRTSPVRDPSPPGAEAAVVFEAASADNPQWVQAHRRTALYAAPDNGTSPEGLV